MRQLLAAAALLLLAACASPVQEQGVRANPRPLGQMFGAAEKTFVWPELRSGDCIMRPGATLVLRPDGTARFNAVVWTTSGDDRWRIWLEAFASNEWKLFSLPADGGTHLKEMALPRSDYSWDISPGTFDPSKFEHIDVVRIFYRC